MRSTRAVAAVAAYAVDEPADLALDVGRGRQHADRWCRYSAPSERSLRQIATR
jgi:hypothetical protein